MKMCTTIYYIYIIILCQNKMKKQTAFFQTKFVMPLSNNVLQAEGTF
jgi:hypothetical protein